jgi:hypothetical protein
MPLKKKPPFDRKNRSSGIENCSLALFSAPQFKKSLFGVTAAVSLSLIPCKRLELFQDKLLYPYT